LGVDAFFAGAHKWLLGLEGVGFGYFSADLMNELRPLTAGWLSHPESEHFLFRGSGHLRYDRELRATPQVFEGSTASAVGFAALEAGVEILLHLGVSTVYEHIQKFHDGIEAQLVKLGFSSLRAKDPELRSGILSFRPEKTIDVPALAAALRARGVVISIPDGLVRLAPHFSNSLDEVDVVVDAFREALKSL
jgi:selenocysteine lyase/cysteine desulfurase